MLAGEDFGRRHQGGLPPGLDHRCGREQRHHGLARADVALQQAEHALGLGEVGVDFRYRVRLRRRERIGERSGDLFREPSIATARPPGQSLLVRAHQHQGELPGQQFVIGEPRPRRRFGRGRAEIVGMMQGRQRLAERRPFLLAQPGFVLPLRQHRHAAERRFGRLAHDVRAEALGQGIDRLDQRQFGDVGFRDHVVRMHHLEHSVVERGCAGQVAPLANRQQLLQEILACVKVGQRDVAGLVACINLVGRARTIWRRRTMAIDRHQHRSDSVRHDIAQLRPCAAIDRAARQMKQQIDDARRIAVGQPGEQFRELRPDARQARQRGEQGIEQGRAHLRTVMCRSAAQRG